MYGVYLCECICFVSPGMRLAQNARGDEIILPCRQEMSCLQQHLLLTAHSRLANLCTPGISPVSTFHLVTGMVGLWTGATVTGLMWLPDTQTQVHTYATPTFPTELSISMAQRPKILITSAFHSYLWREGLLGAVKSVHLKRWGTQHSLRIPFQLNDKWQLFFCMKFPGKSPT